MSGCVDVLREVCMYVVIGLTGVKGTVHLACFVSVIKLFKSTFYYKAFQLVDIKGP